MAETIPIIEQYAHKESIFIDGFKTYDGLVDFDYKPIIELNTATMNWL